MIDEFIKSAPSEIKKQFVEKTVRKGEVIIFEEIKDNYIYILLKGKVEIVRYNESGLELIISIQSKNTIFGEIELFSEKCPEFNVIAIEDSVVVKIPKSLFADWMMNDKKLFKYVYTQLINKLQSITFKHTLFRSKSLYDRINDTLCGYSNDGRLDTLSKKQLCLIVDAPIRSVNRIIHEVKDFKFIKKTFVKDSNDTI